MFSIRDYDYKSSWRPAGIMGWGGAGWRWWQDDDGGGGGAKTAHVPRQSVLSGAVSVSGRGSIGQWGAWLRAEGNNNIRQHH